MTVAVQQPFNLYGPVAPGAVLFTFDFKITDAADLVVTVNDGAPLESGIDYIVTGVGNNDGGDIRLSIGLSGGQMVLLKRQMTLDRQTDYQQNGDFISSTVNNDFDRIWLALQQFGQDLKRSFKLPFATFTNQELTQTPAQRANKAVVFDADGNVSIGADNYIDQAAAAAASANAAQVAAAQTGSDVVTTGSNATTAVNAAQAAIAAANSIDPTDIVHKTGNETVAGIKTFTSSPLVPDATMPGHAINKGQLDALSRVGEIVDWPYPSAKQNGLRCNGAAVSSTVYAPLFSFSVKYLTGATITIGSPAVIGWPSHNLYVNAPVKWTTNNALPTGFVVGTTYYVIAAGFGPDSFQLSATIGGPAIITSGVQSGVHTAIHAPYGCANDLSTFNLPNIPAGYTTIQAANDEGTTTVGQVISHIHYVTGANYGVFQNNGGSGLQIGVGSAGNLTANATGGAANLAAGLSVRKYILFA